MFQSIFDEVYEGIKENNPYFSVGFIFFGLKQWSDEENEKMLRKVCDLRWKLTVGIDFVQQEDIYDSLDRYDKVADKVLADYP